MNTRLFFCLLFSCASLMIFAQNHEDALRFSRTQTFGSARYMAMSGAYGSVGADFSALGVNPAGIGLFRKSEFAFTPLITFNETEASYFGQLNLDNKYNLGISNLGLVFNGNLSGNNAGWKSIQFGIGYNRINNFNNRVFIQGFNNNSSLMTGYVHNADYILPENLDKFSTKLAYDTWLIWEDTNLIYDADAYWGNVLQEQRIITGGSMNELNFTLGSNYGDRLYIGASIGVPIIRYNTEVVYQETDPDNLHPAFVSLTRTENIETRGTGLNLKLGAIARFNDWLRLGAAFHTPTYYSNMEDKWRVRMNSELFLDNKTEKRSAESPRGRFEYELTTPMKFIGSASLVYGKSGLVSIEYEFADYSSARLNSADYKFSTENNSINNDYTAAHNIRLGTEWRLDDIYFRGGYAFLGSPYKSGINTGKGNQFSLGLGLRQPDYYVDFAWVGSTFKENRYIYETPDAQDFFMPMAKQTFNRQQYMLTLGWRF